MKNGRVADFRKRIEVFQVGWSYSTPQSWQLFVDTSNGTRSVTGGSVSTDTWVRVTGTYDGSHVKLFVDCEEEASQTHSGVLDHAVDGLLLGTW